MVFNTINSFPHLSSSHSKNILQLFTRDLNKYGIYVLPCGGGVISEPRNAIYLLKDTYGLEGLRRLCLDIVRCGVSGEDLTLGEGIWSTAAGILYHLADKNVYRELVFIYRQQARMKEQSVCKFNTTLFDSIEFLISCICRRLDKPLPDDIRDVAYEDEVSCFWSEESPVSLILLLPVLFIMLIMFCAHSVGRFWKRITL
jgi:hypothetical protein